MKSQFSFLEHQFPVLAEYGIKAEQALGKDNNICLLNLGRIAENITETLCRRNNISIDKTTNPPDKLLEAGVINENICLKINTLTEIKEDAANLNYSSESAATRLISTALELCKWFISDENIRRFAFLGDLFPDNAPFPTLAPLAEYGSEAEENLFTNTRYCLLCLGDIEEAIVDILLNRNGANLHYSLDQDKRINLLFNVVGMNNKDKIDTLHNIRQIRNDAVHSRYDSESETIQALDETLNLCEWLFKFIVSPGDFMRGVISEITPEGLTISTGKITGFVPLQEIPPEDSADLSAAFTIGEYRIFRVTGVDTDGRITLSLNQALTDPWTNMARRYKKYSVGQLVNVRVKRLAEKFGAFVDVNDGGEELQARIPKSEFGTYTNPPRARDTLRTGDTVQALVQWVSPEHYPYMLMSIAEAENYTPANTPTTKTTPPKTPSMPDNEFRIFCRRATHLQIIRELDSGANPNAANNLGTTALMEAAKNNSDVRVIRELLEAKAQINAKNRDGNTALIFAAAQNTPEVVKLLCEKGAETGILNEDGKKALDYARENTKLNDDAGILQLLAGDEEPPETTPELPVQSKSETETVSDERFLHLCQYGSDEEIIDAVDNGANVNACDRNRTTALMHVARQTKSGQAVKKLIEKGADVNAANKGGVTALLMAVMNTRQENIKILIAKGADVLAANRQEKSVLDYAREKLSGQRYRSLLQMIERAVKKAMKKSAQPKPTPTPEPATETPEVTTSHEVQPVQPAQPAQPETPKPQLNIFRICRSGTLEAISQAIESGANLNTATNNNAVPLMFAAKDNTADAVELIANAAADINAQDNSGNTALFYAAHYNGDDVVEVLLDNGADKSIKNHSGYTAYDYGLRNYRLRGTRALERLRS